MLACSANRMRLVLPLVTHLLNAGFRRYELHLGYGRFPIAKGLGLIKGHTYSVCCFAKT